MRRFELLLPLLAVLAACGGKEANPGPSAEPETALQEPSSATPVAEPEGTTEMDGAPLAGEPDPSGSLAPETGPLAGAGESDAGQKLSAAMKQWSKARSFPISDSMMEKFISAMKKAKADPQAVGAAAEEAGISIVDMGMISSKLAVLSQIKMSSRMASQAGGPLTAEESAFLEKWQQKWMESVK